MSDDIEKGHNGDQMTGDTHLGADHDPDSALRKIHTSGSISISPELFEKIYLNPQNKVKGDLRKTFGNPTPICLIGFLLSLSPLTFALLGFRGAGVFGASNIGAYFGFGGILMIVGGFLEWVLGNTFPATVFTSFGAFWFTYGATLVPSFNAYGAYTDGGLNSPTFASTFAFFLLIMGLMCFVYLVIALRTNMVFVFIFFTLVCAFGCLAGEFWQLANGNADIASKLQTAAGSFTFCTCAAGWYLFFLQLAISVDFPISLPVGDLSGMIKGKSA